MQTAGQLQELARLKDACPPAQKWLAEFDPQAPISAVYDALEHDNSDWLRWMIARTPPHDAREALYNALYALAYNLDERLAKNVFQAVDNDADDETWQREVAVAQRICLAAYPAMWEYAVKPAMRDRVLAFFAAIEWTS